MGEALRTGTGCCSGLDDVGRMSVAWMMAGLVMVTATGGAVYGAMKEVASS